MIKRTFLLAVITSLATVVTFAAEDPGEREMRFRNLDQNQDGHISLFEARDKHRVFHYYQQADKNEDGHLDMAEFVAFEIKVPHYKME